MHQEESLALTVFCFALGAATGCGEDCEPLSDVHDASDLAAVKNCADVDDLFIVGADLTEVVLPKLKTIRRGLTAFRNTSLSRLSFPSLESVPGGIMVVDNEALTEVSFPRVQSTQALILDGNGVSEIPGDFTALKTIDGALSVSQNDFLLTLSSLRQLQHIGGRLIVENNASLPPCEVDQLIAAIGPENIAGPTTVDNNTGAGTCQ